MLTPEEKQILIEETQDEVVGPLSNLLHHLNEAQVIVSTQLIEGQKCSTLNTMVQAERAYEQLREILKENALRHYCPTWVELHDPIKEKVADLFTGFEG